MSKVITMRPGDSRRLHFDFRVYPEIGRDGDVIDTMTVDPVPDVIVGTPIAGTGKDAGKVQARFTVPADLPDRDLDVLCRITTAAPDSDTLSIPGVLSIRALPE